MQYLFLHGLGQTPESWSAVLDCLDEKIGCLCPNLTELLQGQTVNYSNLYRNFAACCDQNEGPLCLCGLSLGAVLALHYTVEHPSKVHALALIAAQYQMPKRLLQFQNVIFHLMPKTMFRETGFGKQDFIGLTRSMTSLDFRDGLHNISRPVLLICGEKDKANRAASESLKTLLPNAKLEIVKNAGHEINIDAPMQLAKLLNAFWRSDISQKF